MTEYRSNDQREDDADDSRGEMQNGDSHGQGPLACGHRMNLGAKPMVVVHLASLPRTKLFLVCRAVVWGISLFMKVKPGTRASEEMIVFKSRN